MKRRWIFWILAVLFLWVVISRFSEIKRLAETLVGGQWQWVALAALLQVAYYIIYTALYQSAFLTVGVQSRLSELLPVTFASIFMNVAAPSGRKPAWWHYLRMMLPGGVNLRLEPRLAPCWCWWLTSVHSSSYWLSLAYLFTHHNLKYYETIAAVIC